MKILFLISGDRVPSSRFRVLAFLPHLRERGHRCTVAASFPQKYDFLPWLGFRPSQKLKRLTRWMHLLAAGLRRYDVVFLERELFDDGTWSMERKFRRHARRMILDVDDGVHLKHPEKFAELARMCDLVIVGNRFLEEDLRDHASEIQLIPTCVELAKYPSRSWPDDPPDRPVVGWMGTTGNLAYLAAAADGLRAVARRRPFLLRLIAGEPGPIDSLNLDPVEVEFVPWNAATEVDELRKFDIGLMPLFLEQPWDKYKCGLKLIQYMAVGVPGIASPVGVNAEIVEPGRTGLLASTPEQWEQALDTLLADPRRRQQMGAAARLVVEDQFSVEGNVDRLEEALRG